MCYGNFRLPTDVPDVVGRKNGRRRSTQTGHPPRPSSTLPPSSYSKPVNQRRTDPTSNKERTVGDKPPGEDVDGEERGREVRATKGDPLGPCEWGREPKREWEVMWTIYQIKFKRVIRVNVHDSQGTVLRPHISGSDTVYESRIKEDRS